MFFLPTLLLCFIAPLLGLQCARFDSKMGATFDLTEVVRSPGSMSYFVEDGDIPCTKTIEKNYTYVFNVCGTVTDGVPLACSTMSGLSSAGALQIDKRVLSDPSDDYCFVAGSYSESTTEVELLDPEDPTKGIVVSYAGDYCNHPRTQRRFNIELSCADRLTVVPSHALEYAHCVYTITMPSVFGCPVECPVSNRKLCSGNGHCAYDYTNSKAMCFCNHGWMGSDCSDPDTSNSTTLNYSPVLLGLIITLFIIIAILVGSIVLMIKQLSAYREDLAHYQVLKGGDEDSTVV